MGCSKKSSQRPAPFSLVLASASSRRQELLKHIWPYAVTAAPQDIDEAPLKNELPRDYVRRVTTEKARAALEKMYTYDTDFDAGIDAKQKPKAMSETVFGENIKVSVSAEQKNKNSLGSVKILSADTIVAVGRRILQKAHNRAEAEKQIQLISGRRHRVLTGIAVASPGKEMCYRLTEVRLSVARLTPKQIQDFLDSGDWQGVSVYRMQGFFGRFIKSINGDPSAILGLPLYATASLLQVA